MPFYKYTAFNQEGAKLQGRISGVTTEEAESKLASLGLEVVTIAEPSGFSFNLRHKVTAQDLIVICIQLEQLSKAGVPLIDAILDIKDNTDSTVIRSIFADIHEQVSQGKMLSEAMAVHANIFDDVFVGLVATGERTGNLAQVFSHLANHLKWVSDMKNRLKKATYYPIFMLFLMIGVISVMMVYVVPKLSVFLTSQGFELPWHTKALIATSGFVSEYGFWVVSSPIIVYSAIKFASRYVYAVAYRMDLIKLYIPIIGPVIRKIEIARFCRFFAITFRSGIDILQSIDISRNVIGNRVIKSSLELARAAVNDGSSLSNAIKATGNFPNLVVRMIKVGEDSGKLDVTLENVNYFFDREVSDSVDNMIGMLQPTLTIILGMIMMWVTTAVFGPLYNSFSKIKF